MEMDPTVKPTVKSSVSPTVASDPYFQSDKIKLTPPFCLLLTPCEGSSSRSASPAKKRKRLSFLNCSLHLILYFLSFPWLIGEESYISLIQHIPWSRMHEIITLQLGQQSNYLATHFWNAQV